jgi:DNA (cytosine-5)-methyltransferase 1
MNLLQLDSDVGSRPFHALKESRSNLRMRCKRASKTQKARSKDRGQNAPKDVYDPLDTFAANGNHHGLMGVNPPVVEDCTFRMLELYEVTWGMTFPRDYIMTGTKAADGEAAGKRRMPAQRPRLRHDRRGIVGRRRMRTQFLDTRVTKEPASSHRQRFSKPAACSGALSRIERRLPRRSGCTAPAWRPNPKPTRRPLRQKDKQGPLLWRQ